ncbi:RagB/SusD family nutrient uptake outer membrane protein [Euzebyella marina]|uniref:RagB/SusD family nutrient uptake outer membrane protein n=1 Tax=Euzebyella marina TaxID=1761453 RepID=A0A3G2L244_9FLAO|nr:RagB/SusD family nutrient uptake outer membrane protein [Euzebyella marina]AYN66276.1 RagB/SusD family nutrient uptake outer membrane protein [Euzebyella marina]
MKIINAIKGWRVVLPLAIVTLGCNDDFTSITPLSEVSEQSVWSDAGLAEATVTGAYNGLGAGGLDEQMLASLTDEAIFTHTGRSINTINESRTNSADPGWVNNTWDWNNMYGYIRDTNLAITNLSTGQIEDNDLVNRLLGESYFLRAYYYHQLLRFYGGVPLIDEPLQLDSDYDIPRNSFEECVNFIVADCERAFDLLDGREMESGRANPTVALALKARILLYAASDLHDYSTASANSSLLSGYSNPELIAYTSGDQQQRWIQARDAVKEALDYSTTGYKLDLTSPVSLEEGQQNYTDIYLASNGGENDIIWERQYVEISGPGRQIGLFNGPNGYHNWAGNAPLQNLVDDYAMSDGSEFDWDNPDHASAPYENREARFYATILYDGADWKPRPSDVTERDPADQIQTGQYEINGSGSVETHFGLDTRQSPVEDWNGTRTGYYTKKFINPDPAFVDQTDFQTIPWPFFRETELVLNYVETLLETGDEAEATNWLNKIRFRVGLPAITATGDELVDVYRNERRVELAYEEHRYHDARRWMIAESTLGAPAVGIQITGELKPGATVSIYKYDPANYDYSYVPTTVDPGFENRLWLDKTYYVPIRIAELNANTALIQNPGYD